MSWAYQEIFRFGGFPKQYRKFCRRYFNSTKLVFRTLSEHDKNPILTKKIAPQTNIFKKIGRERSFFGTF